MAHDRRPAPPLAIALSSPANALQSLLLENSANPFPSVADVRRELASLTRVVGVRGLGKELSVELEACHRRLDDLVRVWIPTRLAVAEEELRELVLLVLNSRGEHDLGAEGALRDVLYRSDMFLHQRGRLTKAQLEGVLSRLSSSGFGKQDLRMAVEPLTEDAKEALFEQLKYLDEAVPGHRLPPPMTILVHAEVGGKYLELVHGVRKNIKSSERYREGALMRDFQQKLPFTFFATLPLELMDALMKEGTSARAGSYLRNATLLFREAIRDVYSRKTVSLVRLFHLDESKFEAFSSWAKTFRESVGQGLPAAEEGGKTPLVYWQEVGDVVRADWKALEKAWEWVVEKFCELGRLPGDEELLKLHSRLPASQHRLLTSHAHADMHTLSRISLRAAKRYGTSQRAWAAPSEGRGI